VTKHLPVPAAPRILQQQPPRRCHRRLLQQPPRVQRSSRCQRRADSTCRQRRWRRRCRCRRPTSSPVRPASGSGNTATSAAAAEATAGLAGQEASAPERTGTTAPCTSARRRRPPEVSATSWCLSSWLAFRQPCASDDLTLFSTPSVFSFLLLSFQIRNVYWLQAKSSIFSKWSAYMFIDCCTGAHTGK
jgi:hypothetical protein